MIDPQAKAVSDEWDKRPRAMTDERSQFEAWVKSMPTQTTGHPELDDALWVMAWAAWQAARAAQAQPSNEWLNEALRWQAATAEAAHLLTDRGGGYIFIAPDGTTIESSDVHDFLARVRAALKNADPS